ncbi:MAG: LysR family transcriptional regulator [Azospirillaceae bacterium]|nr:LysR family transcriptional regulator [Azospirillaceae bacterium]
MTTLPRSTIEQWAVLRAVVEEGGYAAAAAKLNRSQSSVSYAIARLQDAMGVDLLALHGRRAALTEAGAALLAEATPLIDDLARIERRGRGIAGGATESIRLLVDTLFPKARLFRALRSFADLCPDTEIHLAETVRLTVRDVPAEDYDVAVLIAPPGMRDIDPVADVRLIAVAHADHALNTTGQPLGAALLARHPRVEIRGMEPLGEEVPPPGRVWRMNTVESAIDAVRHGLCYGWLPSDHIRREVEDGTLRPLKLVSGAVRSVYLGLRVRQDARTTDNAAVELGRLLAGKGDGDGGVTTPT